MINKLLICRFSIILDYDAADLKISKIYKDYKELMNICKIIFKFLFIKNFVLF